MNFPISQRNLLPRMLWLAAAVTLAAGLTGLAGGCGDAQPSRKVVKEKRYPCPKRYYRTPCSYDKKENKFYRIGEP